MLDEKLIKAVKPYRELNLNDEMNLINIFQNLSSKFPHSLPLNETDIKQSLNQRLTELGLNVDNLLLSKKPLQYQIKQNDYVWPKYHSQLTFKETTKTYPTFSSITFDKKMMALVLANVYQLKKIAALRTCAKHDDAAKATLQLMPNNDLEDHDLHYYFLLPKDDDLINIFVLYALYEKQDHVLNSDLLRYAAKLIYIQQSSISINVNNTKQLKKISYDFGKATNEFLHNFRIPETNSREYDPQIHITDLIKYMNDVLNDRPVDSELFNLITKGAFDNESVNIIINQARQLGLTEVLTQASADEISQIKEKLSPRVAKQVRNIWIINKQKSNKNYKANAKHLLAVHGTQNLSVLNILGEGLLDSVTLSKQGSTHYNYTGSGLGRGIYFARLDQADKSYNYTESTDGVFNYMFVADVAYTKVKHTKTYGDSNDQNKAIDLVWGDAVGSYDRDEIVAKSPAQVEIKYLMELN